MSRLTISQASILSLPALHQVFVKAVRKQFTYFPEDVREQVIRDHSTWKLLLAALDRRRALLVAKTKGEIIGYAIGAAPVLGSAQLYWLYVEPDRRGGNIGLSLLSRMIKLLGEKGATKVSIATHDHRKYYERQGFKFVENTMIDGVKMDILTFNIK